MNFNRLYFSLDNTTWVHNCNAISKTLKNLSPNIQNYYVRNKFHILCFYKGIVSIAEIIMNLRHHKRPNIHVWFLSKYKLYMLILKIWLSEP